MSPATYLPKYGCLKMSLSTNLPTSTGLHCEDLLGILPLGMDLLCTDGQLL